VNQCLLRFIIHYYENIKLIFFEVDSIHLLKKIDKNEIPLYGKQLFASLLKILLANYWQKTKGRQWRPYKRLKISSPCWT